MHVNNLTLVKKDETGRPAGLPVFFPYTLYNINSTHPHRGLKKPTAIDDPHGIRVGIDGVPAMNRRAMHRVETLHGWCYPTRRFIGGHV